MSWTAHPIAPGIVHVVSDNDVIQHEPERCVCVPAVECVRTEDGPDGWRYTHHSLDGREEKKVPEQGR